MKRLRAILVGLFLVAETVVVVAVGVIPASAHCYNTGCDYYDPHDSGCSDWEVAPIGNNPIAILTSDATNVGQLTLMYSPNCGAAYAQVQMNSSYSPPSGYCGTLYLIARTNGNIRASTESGGFCGYMAIPGNGAMLGDANWNQAAQACFTPWFGQPSDCTGTF